MSDIAGTYAITIRKVLLWTFGYFGVMLLYTAIDMGIWRKIESSYSGWLHLATMLFLSVLYIWTLTVKTSFKINIVANITLKGVFLAILCAILFYFLLDKFLDPIFESIFSASEEVYQSTLLTLSNAPVISFIHICILTPIIEESLMRGFVLGGLQGVYGKVIALLVSALLFALFHFNMVQTISAFVCGIILGILYLKTNSLFCCIVAHLGYNTISYFTSIYPLVLK